MALIECPECEGKVSDKASACPHCGYPAPFHGNEKKTLPEQSVRDGETPSTQQDDVVDVAADLGLTHVAVLGEWDEVARTFFDKGMEIPTIMLGIEVDTYDVEGLENDLRKLNEKIEGSAVLVVHQRADGGEAWPIDPSTISNAIWYSEVLDPVAKVVVLFQHGFWWSPCFKVVKSDVEGIMVGDTVADPRSGAEGFKLEPLSEARDKMANKINSNAGWIFIAVGVLGAILIMTQVKLIELVGQRYIGDLAEGMGRVMRGDDDPHSGITKISDPVYFLFWAASVGSLLYGAYLLNQRQAD